MTPTSQDGLGAEPSRLAHANSSRERRARERRRAIVASCVMASALALGLFIVREAATSFSTPEHGRPSADEGAGIIKLSREGDRCRQLILDNRTGRTTDGGLMPCEKAPSNDPKERLKERYSGGRLDSIRDSFRAR